MNLQEIIIGLKEIAAECEKVTSGNISHRIANIEHGILNLADSLENYFPFGWRPASEKSDIKNGETIIILFRHPINGRLLPWETTYNGELPFDAEWWIRKPKED